MDKSTSSRPSWDEYFLGLCWLVKERSPDKHTKHGAIITENNRILGVGYNGPPSGIELTNEQFERPTKYLYMVHSEINCIANCTHKPINGTLYVTGRPCESCILAVAQFNIYRIVYLNRVATAKDNEQIREAFNNIIKQKNIEVVCMDFPSWIAAVDY